MHKEQKTCRFRRFDIIRLEVDAETKYLVLNVYPSNLQLTTECKYDILRLSNRVDDLIEIPDGITRDLVLRGIQESQIRTSQVS